MPSNAAATTTTFKTSDFEYDAAANKMSEERVDQEKLGNSIPTRKVGRPGRKRKQISVASCEASKEGPAGPDGQSSEQVPNGELGGHGGGSSSSSSSRQDRNLPENGVSRERALRPPARLLENGLLSAPPDDPDQEEEGGDGEPAPPTPRKKRGRRKLEHPEKHVEDKEEGGSDAARTEVRSPQILCVFCSLSPN